MNSKVLSHATLRLTVGRVALPFLATSLFSATLSLAETSNSPEAEQTRVNYERETREIGACTSAVKDLSAASAKLSKACGKAGLGNNCYDKVQMCQDDATEFGTEGTQWGDLIAQGFSSQYGIALPLNQFGQSCPSLSGKDYFTQKDKLEKDIETVNKDIQKAKDKLLDEKKDFDTKFKAITKEMETAEKDLTKNLEGKKKEKRDQVKKSQEERAALVQKVSTLTGDISTAQDSLAASSIDAKNQQALYDTSLISAECKRQIETLRMQYLGIVDKDGKPTDPALRQRINNAEGVANRNNLIKQFNSCMKGLRDKFISETRSNNNKLREARRKLDLMKSDREATQGAILKADQDQKVLEQEMLQSENTALQAAQQTILNSRNAQTELQNNFQVAQQNNEMTVRSLMERLAKLQLDQVNLGPLPPNRNEESWQDAGAEINAVEDLAIAKDEACCSGAIDDEDIRSRLEGQYCKEGENRAARSKVRQQLRRTRK